jgi:hypothetical protein
MGSHLSKVMSISTQVRDPVEALAEGAGFDRERSKEMFDPNHGLASFRLSAVVTATASSRSPWTCCWTDWTDWSDPAGVRR